jgi:hypothetical protein
MSPEDRAALRATWLADLQGELDRRRAVALVETGGDPRSVLLLKLEEMSDRLRSDPDFRELAPSQERRRVQQIEGWGSATSSRCRRGTTGWRTFASW